MTWPDPSVNPASYDLDANSTQGRAVSDILWPMMVTRRRILAEIPIRPKIDQPLYEIMYEQTNPPYVLLTDVSGTTIEGSNSGTGMVIHASTGSPDLIRAGTVLRNRTRPTPIGTYFQNECLLVTSNTSGTLEVVRDCFNANSGTGSTAHAATDEFEIVYTNIGEGSLGADQANHYKITNRIYNHVSGFGFKLQVTGDAFARGMWHVQDTLARQWSNRMLELENHLASAILYSGYQLSGDEGGSDSYLSWMRGVDDFVCASGANVDVTNTTLHYDAVDNLFVSIVNDGGAETDSYIIVTAPRNVQTMSHWDDDKVRLTMDEKRTGRYINEFISTTGASAPVIVEPKCNPNDLFVINTSKWGLVPFRPFETWEYGRFTANETGDDIWNKRVLGKYTFEFVDATTAHAAMKRIGGTEAY